MSLGDERFEPGARDHGVVQAERLRLVEIDRVRAEEPAQPAVSREGLQVVRRQDQVLIAEDEMVALREARRVVAAFCGAVPLP